MEDEVKIDRHGFINGIDPSDWQALAKAPFRLTDEQRHIAASRYYDPNNIALRQGVLPVLDLRDSWQIEKERRVERSETNAIDSGQLR